MELGVSAERRRDGSQGTLVRCAGAVAGGAGAPAESCRGVSTWKMRPKLVRGVTPGDWAAFGRDESGAFAVPDQFFRLLRVGALIRGMRCCLFGSARSGETGQRGAGLQKPAVDWACADLQVCSNSRFCPNRCSCSNPTGSPWRSPPGSGSSNYTSASSPAYAGASRQASRGATG